MKQVYYNIVVLITAALLFTSRAKAEGSKDLMADVSSRAALSTVDGTFAAWNSSNSGNERKKLNIHITTPGSEIVYFGFSAGYSTGISDILGEGSASTANYYIRIKDPNGNVVFGPQILNASNAIPVGTTGFNQVKAGPAAIAGASGYAGFSFTPAAGAPAGDYYIEFNKDSVTFDATQCSFDYWDITVANRTTLAPLPGRIWANQWGFYSKDYTSGGYTGVFKGIIYSYTTEGFVNKVDFSNSDFRGGAFLIGMNSTGPGTSGNVITDRQSLYLIRTVGNEYKLFMNNPDILAYPTGDATPPVLTMGSLSVACGATSIPITFNLSRAGKIDIILDFNNNGVYDAGTTDVQLAANGTVGSNTITWNMKDGQGNTVNETVLANVRIILNYQLGTHHISLSDIEYLSNGFTVQAVRPLITPGFVTKFYWDDTKINSSFFGNKVPYATGPQPNVVELGGAPVRKWDNFTGNSTPGFGNSNSINTWWNSYESRQTYQFAVQSCTVPVRLISFNAAAVGKNVQVKWTVAQEINVSRYEVESGTDGVHYQLAGTVHAAGSSAYTFLHTSPAAGVNYYRLKMIDLDGSVAYSDVRKVNFVNEESVSVYPNPATSVLNITATGSIINKAASVQVFSMEGKLVMQKQVSALNRTESFNVSALATGKYIMRISSESEVITKSFQVIR